MITFNQGRYHYGDFKLTLDFTIAKGRCVGILGPSGAGKSTLLSLVAGFERLTSGNLMIDGLDMAGVAPASRPVSLVFQDHNTFSHLDSWTNVALGIDPGLRLSAQQKLQVDEALDRVGLSRLLKRRPGEMSGGERQRIALARVLVRNKPVLLLDEAFAALGPALRHEMLELVLQLHTERKLTTLMVTHQPGDARRIADQVIFVDGNKVRAPIATKSFFEAGADPAIAAYLGDDD